MYNMWEKQLSDKSTIFISDVYLPGLGKLEREYLVKIRKENGHCNGVCLLGEDGHPKKWYNQPYDKQAVEEAIKELSQVLLVEQIHGT